MEIDFAILADAAEQANGKLSLLGGAFDTIWAQSLPVIHNHLSFVVRFLFAPVEFGRKHAIEVNVMDEDAKPLAKVGAEIQLGAKNPNLPAGWRQGVISILNFQNLKFDKYGNYSFEIVVNNTSLKSVPFKIGQLVKM